jgi:hypothetical protein
VQQTAIEKKSGFTKRQRHTPPFAPVIHVSNGLTYIKLDKAAATAQVYENQLHPKSDEQTF